MTSRQKNILSFLSIIASLLLAIVLYLGIDVYQDWMAKPLGPPLAPLPTWTPESTQTSVPTGTLAQIMTPTSPPLCGGPRIMTILAIGTDQRVNNYNYGLADIVRLVRIDFVTPRLSILEFPRDLYVEIPEIADNPRNTKHIDHGLLNQSYLYGAPGDGTNFWDGPSGGPGLLTLTLNKNFSVSNVDHYITVNMRTFEKIINAVDGIDVTISDYQTAYNTGLKIGKHHLDGASALRVARNRKEGMYARVTNQNLVLCALRKKILSPGVVPQIPALIDSFKDNIQTDMSPEQISQLACLGARMPTENIAFASFPRELLTEKRFYGDKEYPNGLYISEADFNILSAYVRDFQMGIWPEFSSSAAPTETSATPEPEFTFCE